MAGDPLFVVTAEANAGLVMMLPVVLQEVRAFVGEKRVTVVFDRGGWSPNLFSKLITEGFDILTYRKEVEGGRPAGRKGEAIAGPQAEVPYATMPTVGRAVRRTPPSQILK